MVPGLPRFLAVRGSPWPRLAAYRDPMRSVPAQPARMPRRQRRNTAALTACALVASAVALLGPTGVAQAAASCPTVDAGTGALSPVPSASEDLSGCDLTGADLTGLDLSSADLTGATLTGATLAGADLTSATLAGVISGSLTGTPTALPTDWVLVNNYLAGPAANLTAATLSGADLTNVNLSAANLTGATLTGATLTNTDLSSATLRRVVSGSLTGTPTALPTNWSLVQGYLVGPEADLSGAQLAGAALSGQDLAGATAPGIVLTGAGLVGTDFTGATLTDALVGGADLSAANLTSADLTGALLTGSTVAGADFTSATLTRLKACTVGGVPVALPTPWSLVASCLVGPTADLTGGSFTGADLSELDLHDTKFKGADLDNAILDRANLTGADLSDATLRNTSLTASTLTNVDLSSAVLTGNDLAGLDLSTATLDRIRPSALTYSSSTALPTGWRKVGAFIIGPRVDLTDADLAGLSLHGMNLTDVILAGATLQEADLADTVLTDSTITDADFRRADLTGVTSGGLVGTPLHIPVGWRLIDGTLLGQGAKAPGIDLTGSNLAGINLTNAVLTGADLTDANLAGAYLIATNFNAATLNGADLTGANMDGVDLTNAKVRFAVLLQAKLTGATLKNTDLHNSNLTYVNAKGSDATAADLTNVDLTYSSFYGADLTTANLLSARGITTANVDSVTWRQTICPDGTISEAHLGGSCINALDTTAPRAAITAPSGSFQSAASFAVRWRGTDAESPVVSYQVQSAQRPARSTQPLSPWTDWRAFTTATSGTFAGVPDTAYCFRVRATNAAGLESSWSSVACTTTPLDDRALTRSSGWRFLTGPASLKFFNNTTTASARSGAALTSPTSRTVKQVALVAYKCRTCGSVTIFVGSTKVASTSLRANTSGSRSLITLPALRTAKSGKIRLIVGSGGGQVRIDAVLSRSS